VASRPKFWPQPQTFGLGLAAVLLSYYVIGLYLGKNRVKFGNFINFSGNNLKSYVVNHYLVLFYNYFWPRPWPQPPEIGLGLEVLASFNITKKYTYIGNGLNRIMPRSLSQAISVSNNASIGGNASLTSSNTVETGNKRIHKLCNGLLTTEDNY